MTEVGHLRSPLFITAAGCVGPWGVEIADLLSRADSPVAPPPELPSVPRFVESNFPLAVSQVVSQVKGRRPPAEQVGFVLATSFGDVTTTDVASRRMAEGRPHNPLLFYQSIPNSILGHLSKGTNFTGPLSCVSAADLLLTQALTVAELTLEEGSADQILLIGVDLAESERIAAIRGGPGTAGTPYPVGPPRADIAVVLVVQRQPSQADGCWRISAEQAPRRLQHPDRDPVTGSMRAFVEVCAAYAGDSDRAVVLDGDQPDRCVSYALHRLQPVAAGRSTEGVL